MNFAVESIDSVTCSLENPYNSCVNDLSKGLLDIYNKPLNNAEQQLKELTAKQNLLIIQIHDENLNLAQVQHSPEIHDVFNKIKVYHNKLTNIKRDMKAIYERSTKLKKRALRLQQDKERGERAISSKPDEIIVGEPGSSSS